MADDALQTTIRLASVYHQWVAVSGGNYRCSQCGNYDDPSSGWNTGYCPKARQLVVVPKEAASDD